MYYSNRAIFQTLLSIDTATFTGSYQFLGTLTYPARVLIGVNGSTTTVTVSFDGTNAHMYFGASNATPQEVNFGNARGTAADALELPQGTPIYVKGAAGVGLFTVTLVSAYQPSTQVPQ